MNPLATSFELVHYFEVACPKIIAVDASLFQNVVEAMHHLSFSPKLIVIEDVPNTASQVNIFVSQDLEFSYTETDNATVPPGL